MEDIEASPVKAVSFARTGPELKKDGKLTAEEIE
jgi:hypothetical protein